LDKSSSKTVALVANTSWSLYNFRLGVIRAMLKRGIEVIAIAPRDDYSDKLTAEGVTYVPISMRAHGTSPLSDLRTWRQLLSVYKSYRPDLVIHYTIKMNIYGSLVCRWLGIKSVSVVTGLGRTFQLSRWTQPIINQLYRAATKGNHEVWVLNAEDKERLVQEKIVASEKIYLLPSEGVNTRKFIGSESKPNKQIFRFLYAGRLLHDKGILEFVKAAKELSKTDYKVKCEVVGFVNPEDSMSVSLKDLQQWQKEGYINYLGSHEDIRPFIDKADCVVYPSYYQEGISRILLEAASMSRPIITTDQVGCRDVIIKNKTGLLIPTKSLDHLVKAMVTMMDMPPEDRTIMGHLGRKLVKEKYEEDRVIEIYFERLLSDLIIYPSSPEQVPQQ